MTPVNTVFHALLHPLVFEYGPALSQESLLRAVLATEASRVGFEAFALEQDLLAVQALQTRIVLPNTELTDADLFAALFMAIKGYEEGNFESAIIHASGFHSMLDSLRGPPFQSRISCLLPIGAATANLILAHGVMNGLPPRCPIHPISAEARVPAYSRESHLAEARWPGMSQYPRLLAVYDVTVEAFRVCAHLLSLVARSESQEDHKVHESADMILQLYPKSVATDPLVKQELADVGEYDDELPIKRFTRILRRCLDLFLIVLRAPTLLEGFGLAVEAALDLLRFCISNRNVFNQQEFIAVLTLIALLLRPAREYNGMHLLQFYFNFFRSTVCACYR
jgi:hypothetical protein